MLSAGASLSGLAPPLWKRCGSTAKSYAIKCVPWILVSAGLLLALDWNKGAFTGPGDASRPILGDIMLGLPVGVLTMFLFNFVRFVHEDDAQAA